MCILKAFYNYISRISKDLSFQNFLIYNVNTCCTGKTISLIVKVWSLLTSKLKKVY